MATVELRKRPRETTDHSGPPTEQQQKCWQLKVRWFFVLTSLVFFDKI